MDYVGGLVLLLFIAGIVALVMWFKSGGVESMFGGVLTAPFSMAGDVLGGL
jgi:hypothetical protein